MPYRTARKGYYRRRNARPSFWVRNNILHDNAIPNSQLLVLDLLAPLHTQDAVIKIGGMYENAPTATGRTCVRIHGAVTLTWSTDGVNPLQVDDGAYVGIQRATWNNDSATRQYVPDPANVQDPYDPKEAANTSDWSFWKRFSVFDENHVDTPYSDTWIGHWDFDVRAKRALREIGDSMVMSIRPDGDGTQGLERALVTTSVLLR